MESTRFFTLVNEALSAESDRLCQYTDELDKTPAEKKKQMLDDFSVYNQTGVQSAITLFDDGFFENRKLKEIAAEEVFDALMSRFKNQ